MCAVSDKMHPFAAAVAAAIDRHGLLRDDGRCVVVALSGGADSVALLAVLDELGYNCLAAHCNFHLRGEESQRDMRHCEKICDMLGLNLAVRDFDVDKRRKATGESVEMACRSLRYDWFDSLIDREHAQAVAVGHHREDQIETLMLNLLRGTGIAGLRGMSPRRGFVVRPMLDCTREQILDYLASRSLDYVTDSSNASDVYRRNRLRNRVLPVLREFFPGADDALLGTMSTLRACADFYDDCVVECRRRYITRDGAVDRVDIAALLADRREPDRAAHVLYEMLRDVRPSMTQCRDIIAAGAGASGLHFDVGTAYRLELDRGLLSIFSLKDTVADTDDETEVSLRRDILTPVNIVVTEHPIADFRPERNPAVAYLDVQCLEGNPRFALRRYRRGDRIEPFGMNGGSRLLSDLFRDAGYSAADKRSVWVLTRDDVILWVVGLRASRHFPVIPVTRRYLRLEFRR